METAEKRAKRTHHGHALTHIITTLGVERDTLATELKMPQDMILTYEGKEVIEDTVLDKFATVLGVSSRYIKELEEEPLTMIIENNTYENNKDTAIATGYIAGNNIVNNNPVDKIAELFEKLAEKREKRTHHGNTIKRIRTTLKMKQETLAMELGMTQAMISVYESKEIIEDSMLDKFAAVLGVSSEFIKELDEDPVIVIIENNTCKNNKDTAIATGDISGR